MPDYKRRVFKNVLVNDISLRVRVELTDPLRDKGVAIVKTALGDKQCSMPARITKKTPRRGKPALYEFLFDSATDKGEDIFVATVCSRYDFIEVDTDVEQLEIFVDKEKEV